MKFYLVLGFMRINKFCKFNFTAFAAILKSFGPIRISQKWFICIKYFIVLLCKYRYIFVCVVKCV